MKKTTIILVIVIAIVIVGGIWYMTAKNKNKSETSSDVKNLKVAMVIPLTGSLAQLGEDFLNGINLVKEKINPNVILYIEDSQSNAKDGISAARKILDTEQVDVMVSMQSAVVMPLLTIADQYGKPLIATTISQDEFTQKSKNAFRLFFPASKNAALAAELANQKGFKRVSILAINDEYGQSMKKFFELNFKGQIIHKENFDPAERDFRTVLKKMEDSEAIYFLGYNPHYIELFKQREELGEDITLISNENMASNYIKSQVGNLYKNFYAVTPAATIESDKTQAFREEFNKKYGHYPDWMAAFGYDMMLVLDAVGKTGGSPIDALYKIKVDGLNGTISFDANREIGSSLIIVEPENGVLKKTEF
jgi:ABC-type branched-subunit amino acid transport system substrate-binding protein